jgi:outer membrane protein OmpA-like peptidoglycan-associated protein
VATLSIVIVAVAANPPSITWSVGVTAEYIAYVGTAFTSDAPSNSNSADSAVYSIQPGLPAGLTIDAVTGVISGTATATSSSVSYVITAANGAGSSTISLILTVLPAQVGSGGSGGSGSSAPTYNGPEITSITPRLVTTNGGELVVVVGRRLGTGMDVIIGGVTVKLQNASATGFSFIMPALSVATYDMVYRYDGGARLTYIEAIRVAAAVTTNPDSGTSTPTVSPEPKPTPKPWSAIGVANMFAPGSAVVNAKVRDQVTAMLRKYASQAKRIECTGFTMGPNVLARDAKLSRDRAVAVCNLIKQLRPRLEVVRVQGKQETRLGGVIRRVEVRFTR